MKRTPILAFLAIAATASAQQSGHKISMVFTDTDAAYVLQAISKQTGESVLYNNKAKIPVTINLSVDSADEAIRAVSSAASLIYRRVNGLFVVAPPASMKDALMPYCTTSVFTIDTAASDDLVTKLQNAFPYATFRAVGDKVSVTGTKDDLLDIDEAIKAALRNQKVSRVVTDLYMMQRMNAEEVLPLVKTLYPGIEISSTIAKTGTIAPRGEDTSRIITQSYGAIGLRGPEQIVKSARATLEKLDEPVLSLGANQIQVRVYNLLYANGPSVATVLKKAFPELDVIVGPEEISPVRPIFAPIYSDISGSSSGSGSGGSTGSTGSTGGGGASGGGASGGSSSGGSTSGGTSTGTGGTGIKVGDRAKAIVLRGRSNDVEAALKLLTEIDVRPRQVVIEVKVIETSPTDSVALGVSYTFSPVNFYDVSPGTALSAASGAITQSSGSTQSIGPSQFSRTPLNFAATLSAMVSNQTAKLLATPSLHVIDNDQGSFFIGNTIAVELSSTSGLGATSQSIAQFPVGIILLVSPRISPDGRVTMHVNPVVSTVSSINSDGIPQTSAREADTTMIVNDGETVVLGGLIQDQETRTITQVPFLAQLPLVGELFKNRTSTRNRSDIIVSITPHIVKDTETKK